MDVPFISSGALNTTHYALVRNVEEAASAQAADTYLMTEVHSIRERLTRPGLTTVRVLLGMKWNGHPCECLIRYIYILHEESAQLSCTIEDVAS